MRVLLVGGAGYVGSHTAVALESHGHEAVILDDLSNASEGSIDGVRQIVGRGVAFVQADARDAEQLSRAFERYAPVDAVILLAGRKAVAESVQNPLAYYGDNISIALATLEAMARNSVSRIVFSSSATVYSSSASMPVDEEAPTSLDLANPYGKTKRIIEEILRDACRATPSLNATILRYFNPVGAHESGLIGENPVSAPTNLMPIISGAAAGARDGIDVFGTDYPTPDGTALRDYVHVQDLAEGHVAALNSVSSGAKTFNLGTGKPTSVLELIAAFEVASGRPITRRNAPRRPGDVAVSYADPGRAQSELGWHASRSIEDACVDYWRWQSQHA